MASVTETLRIVVDAATGAASAEMKAFGAASAEAGAAQKAAATQGGLLQSTLSKLGVTSGSTGSLLKAGVAGGAIFAGAALTKFALDGVQDFARLTGEVRGFQRVTGATAGTASEMTFALQHLGIDADVGATAFGRFAQRVGQGKVDLSAWGVEVARTKTGAVDVTKTVENLSEVFRGIEDPTQRAALGMEAFGRGWQTLAPLLLKGKEGLKSFFDEAERTHHVFTEEDLQKGKEYTLAMRELSSTMTGLKMELGQAFVPVLTEITHGLSTSVQSVDALAEPLGGLGGLIKIGFDAGPIGQASRAAKGFGEIVHGDIGEGLKDLTFRGGPLGDILGGMFSSEKTQAVSAYADQQNQLKIAVGQVADMTTKGATKTTDYKNALKAAGAIASETADDQDSIAQALQKVTQNANDARVALDNMTGSTLQRTVGAAMQVANAGLQVADAQQGIADAANKVTVAEEKVAAATRDHGAASSEARDAQIALADAQLGTTKASQGLASAQLNAVIAANNQDAAVNMLISDVKAHKISVDDVIHSLMEQKSLHPELAASYDVVIQKVKDQLNALGLLQHDGKPWVATVEVNGAQALAELLQIRGSLAAIGGHYLLTPDQYTSADSLGMPYGAEGAIVTQPTLALIGEAGPEMLTPLNRMPGASPLGNYGGGGDVHIYVSGSVVTERDLVDAVAEGLRQKIRVSGSQGLN